MVLTRRSLADRPYCAVRGVSCAWVGHPVDKDLLKSVIMKTYLATRVGKRERDLLISTGQSARLINLWRTEAL